MKNGHLPARLGWVAYKFKLWPGVRYGLATLAMPLEAAQRAFQHVNFDVLPLLGVNQNLKQVLCSLHCVFGGIGLYSQPVEHAIAMINMLIQHYGTETMLAKKFSASIEALQLEIGCIGNPLNKDYNKFHLLATHSWIKSLWEQLHFYKFTLHLEYGQLDVPQRNDALMVTMFWTAGYKGTQIISLNRCHLTDKAIFLSDLATACGRFLDLTFLVPPDFGDAMVAQSSYVLPNEWPSRKDWKLWWDFWMLFTGHGGIFHIPLGEWLAQTHRIWEWHYCKEG
jgi:hypothetical protein